MKDFITHLWNSGKEAFGHQNVQGLDRSLAVRILNTLTFIVVVILLGLWIIAFLVLKDDLLTKTLSGNLLTNLSCLIFFGGLVLSIFIGALIGNLLRRVFWKMWMQGKKY
jgi:hypothetical protein